MQKEGIQNKCRKKESKTKVEGRNPKQMQKEGI